MPAKQDKPRSRRGADSYRSRGRAANHDAALAAAAGQQAPAIPDHPLIPAGAPALVTTTEALDDLIDELRTGGSFVYDTEFIGELSYFPQLCLIQVGTAKSVALIDPLEVDDLSRFWELLADPQVEKIVHAGAQDLEPVVRHLDQPPANIFDTQIAAGFAGLGYPTGLTKLVQELLGVKLGAPLTYTNWAHRPLSAMHQRYAADDVRFGAALKAAIDELLEAPGTRSYVAEECAALSDKARYQPGPQNGFARIRGATSLKPGKQQVLRALLEVRDAAARRQDVPPRALMKDDILIKLARRPVDNVDALAQVAGLPRPVREAHGQAIVDAIAAALAQPTTKGVRVDAKRDETVAERVAIDSLWAAVTAFCLGRSIDPILVATRQEIATCYRAAVADGPPVEGRLAGGWRKALLGPFLADFVAGKTHVRLDWIDDTLRAQAAQDRRD